MRRAFRQAAASVALLLLAAAPSPGQGYSPQEAVGHMAPADGFLVRLVAAEPMVRQPVCIEFDDRGRLWVIQYLQYPNPAGLKRVRVDRYSRTVYDRVPEPPPKGPKGADRITILDGFDHDGRATRSKDFLSDLNLATGLAFGHGGVFVLQVPYLLFYPDKDGDDAPDGDPDVLLTGFGMEDAHSLANSLTWGPDGWLYGCQGSTVTANIRGVEFQQGIWRYHPITHRFELFCEGGGNSWGLDFDRRGDLLYSTNVGGYCMLHGVQGGYYWKQFGKHGALHNPYAYGYFDHVPHQGFRGGHVTAGGIVYQGDAFPERFRGKYLAADLLGHNVYWHDIEPRGATFRAAFGGELLRSNDTWFAPCDLTTGPDGCVYVADWFDKRTAHPDPDADWDKSNGRVYRIEPRRAGGVSPPVLPDWKKLPSEKLVELLSHRNDWLVRRARRVLAERRDPEMILPLRRLVFKAEDEELALQYLWALYVSGGFTEGFAEKLVDHPAPHVRSWTVRLLGDDSRVSPDLAQRLARLAAEEPSAIVRCQLACTAKRLQPADALPIIRQLIRRDLDGQDSYLPLLLWWALERHAITALDDVTTWFASAEAWRSSLARDVILERLTRRYAAEGTMASLTACARLLTSAPTASARGRLLAALDQGLQERARVPQSNAGTLFQDFASVDRRMVAPTGSPPMPGALEAQLAALWRDDTTDAVLIRLLLRLGRPAAQQRATTLATDPASPLATRLVMLQTLGDVGSPSCVPALLRLLEGQEPEAVKLAALAALQRFDQPEVPAALLRVYPQAAGALRHRLAEALLGRKPWALAFLRAIDQGTFPAKDVQVEQLRIVSLHQDKQLDALVLKHWGTVKTGTPEEKLAEMRRLSNDLRGGAGDPTRGRALFLKHCANCHQLFGEGERVGPDLTHANRKDSDYLLVSIVDPSAVIRKEYVAYSVQTTDGRAFSGLIIEQTPGGITFVSAKNERTTVPRDRIAALEESPVSLMPEDLLKGLKPQELRDLFSYLQGDGPARGAK